MDTAYSAVQKDFSIERAAVINSTCALQILLNQGIKNGFRKGLPGGGNIASLRCRIATFETCEIT